MEIEIRPLAEIRPYDKNPRLNDQAVEAVARSIEEFGFRQPIVVDADGVIVVGHTRWKAALKLGLEQVPVHVAREMTPDEIVLAIESYADAALRAKEAGFDGVQLHGAHGFLISQFLSPFVNRRTDEWGGDLDGRMHFLRAVCQAVREQVGPDSRCSLS